VYVCMHNSELTTEIMEITGDYWRLQEITGDYWRLLEITSSKPVVVPIPTQVTAAAGVSLEH